jgi:hypothetical protein
VNSLRFKARNFRPGDGAQLGIYMTAGDRLLCHPDDKLTLGLLLVRKKNRMLVSSSSRRERSTCTIALRPTVRG